MAHDETSRCLPTGNAVGKLSKYFPSTLDITSTLVFAVKVFSECAQGTKTQRENARRQAHLLAQRSQRNAFVIIKTLSYYAHQLFRAVASQFFSAQIATRGYERAVFGNFQPGEGAKRDTRDVECTRASIANRLRACTAVRSGGKQTARGVFDRLP